MEGGERYSVQHRYGVQTSRIRPIAFDIVKDVGVSGVVQPCLPSHTLLWCAREDHGCDRSEALMSCPTAWTKHQHPKHSGMGGCASVEV